MDWFSFSLGFCVGIVACGILAMLAGVALLAWVHSIDRNDAIF